MTYKHIIDIMMSQKMNYLILILIYSLGLRYNKLSTNIKRLITVVLQKTEVY